MFSKKRTPAPQPAPVATQGPRPWHDFLDNSFLQEQMNAMLGSCSGGPGLSGQPDLDDARLADREAAAAELGSSFKIVQNDSESDGNAVTQEEFDEIAAMYSDIRTGNSHIEIGGGLKGDALKAFKKGTMTDIGRILQTKSGRELLKQTMNGRDEDGKALTTKIGPAAKGDASSRADDLERAQNGKGSGASIAYNPQEAIQTKVQGASWGDEVRSDVTLYHELVHAKHMREGQVSKDRLTEEKNAVGMGTDFPAEHFEYFENRYRHERRMIGHGDVGVVDGDKGMAQRDNYMGGEGGSGDWGVPYEYAGDTHTKGER